MRFICSFFSLPETGVITHYYDNVFVTLLVPFSYEDKRLAQRRTLTHPLTNGMQGTTQNMHMCRRQTLNTRGKLIL